MLNIKKFINWYLEEYWILENHFDSYWINKLYYINKNIILFWTSLIHLNDNWEVIWYIKKFDLTITLEKKLATIYSFLNILNRIENVNDILYWLINAEEWFEYYNWTYLPVDLYWGEDMWSYYIQNRFPSYIENNEKILSNWIRFWYSNYQDTFIDLPIPQALNSNPVKYSFYEESNLCDDIREDFLTFKEFYLLIQIYFWLFQEHEYLKVLDENEVIWKYDELKYYIVFNNWLNENPWKSYQDYKKWFFQRKEVEEYLKLQLMRKDTSGAFDWLKIEKIYDIDWSDEKNIEYIDKINKEFWEEIIVME